MNGTVHRLAVTIGAYRRTVTCGAQFLEEVYAKLARFPAHIVDRAANRDVRRLFVSGSSARQVDPTPASLFPSRACPRRGLTDPLAGVLLLSGPDQPGPEHAIPGLHAVAGRDHPAIGWLFLAHLSRRRRGEKSGNWPDLTRRAAVGHRHRHSSLRSDRRTLVNPTWLWTICSNQRSLLAKPARRQGQQLDVASAWD